jgi:hypothetical protein
MKNLVNGQQLLFTEMWWHSKFGSNLCKIHWEKYPKGFVKVVEGSEIYKFTIHHFVHFYSKFWNFTRSNSGTVKRFWASRRRAGPTNRIPRPRLPEAPHLPKATHKPRRIEVIYATCRAPLVGRPPAVYRRSVRCPGSVHDAYKRGDRPPRTRRPPPPTPSRSAPSPLAPPRRAPPSAPSRRRTTTLSPSLDHIEAHPAARCLAPPHPRQNHSSQLCPPPGATTRCHRRGPPKPAINRALGESRTPPHHFSTDPRRAVAGIPVEPPLAVVRDSIAGLLFFLGSYLQSRDISVST